MKCTNVSNIESSHQLSKAQSPVPNSASRGTEASLYTTHHPRTTHLSAPTPHRLEHNNTITQYQAASKRNPLAACAQRSQWG